MQLQHMENLLVYEEEQCYAGGDQTWYEDEWHWVIVHSISETGRICFCDEGKWQEDDPYAWLHTTTLGGGFVYFHIQNKIQVASKNT